MQPKSIQRFDIFYLGSLAVYIAGFFLGYDDTVALTRQQYAEAGLNLDPSMWIAIAFAIGLGISVLLWWLVSSRGSNIAKWILVVFLVLGVLVMLFAYSTGAAGPLTLATGLSLLSTALSAVAIFYLFKPDAKEWLERERP
jgi:hypothetical protein